MDDGYTDGNSQTTPRGTETWFYVMCGFSSCTYYGFMKFDLSDISGTIDSVSLKLRRHTPDEIVQLYFYRITRDWSEPQFTWDNAETSPDTVAWTTGGGDYNSTKIDSLTDKGAAAYDEDVFCQRGDGVGLTELIQDWVDGTYNNYGMIIRTPILGMGDTVYVYSSENFNETLWPRPKLYVEYTPDPSEAGVSRRKKLIIESRE
ncbi:MAG: DNRLRE domain-containing protein, partial [candidate division Zixibacteria bacterium]